MKFIILFLISFSLYAKVSKELVTDGHEIIWGMDFIDSNQIIFSEKSGGVKILNLKTKKVTKISGAPKVHNRGQGGLLDIKLHPNFEKNKRVYLSYSKKTDKGATTALGFGLLKKNNLENFEDIFVGVGVSSERRHYGSRIAFNKKNQIYLTIGDRGERDNAQDLKNHFGKVIRINDDGSVPKDNPFVGKEGALAEIWSYGHRNPQGLVFDAMTETLYEMEHGPRGGDEINIINPGKNYGWPKASYGKEYMLPMSVGEEKVAGTIQPFKYYVPSIAPCGLVYYRGERYKDLNESLISGALKLTHLNVFKPTSKKEMRLLDNFDLRVRSVAISPDDYIYFSTDSGQILKLKP